jgi:AGCS family alanine or glycine:cation symporter
MKPMKRFVVVSLLATLALSSPALASEPAAEEKEDIFKPIDDAFGKWFVGPMAKVMFWDVWFWDNTIDPSSISDPKSVIGSKVGDATIVGVDAGKGFELRTQKDVPAADAKQLVAGPFEQTVGKLTVTVTGTSADDLKGVVKEGPVDITGLEQEPAPGAAADAGPGGAPPQVIVKGLAPFLVKVAVVGHEAKVLAQDVPKEHLKLPALKAGDTVDVGGTKMTVEAIDGETLKVASAASSWSTDAIKNPAGVGLPLVVLWLVLGACFFTLRMGFINLRAFGHALRVTRGDYDNPDDPGEVTHFQALSSALSATVGLGNIAGVAVAVGTGGPGAIFWMICAGFLGMSSKFVECTLGQLYRHVDENGVVSGGPMRYLKAGLEEKGLGAIGRPLSIIFAIMCIGGSLGGGNMFQANQAFAAVAEAVNQVSPGSDISGYGWIFGVFLAVMVGLVIIGGIKRIGAAASFIVPFMCGLYLLAGAWVLLTNVGMIGEAIGAIVGEAFTPRAGLGGAIGVLMVGFQRAAFSNEAGVGSAAIAHSAAATDEPVREGIVALLGPFIDTIVVCTMTGLVVVITQKYADPAYAGAGVAMTQAAFGTVISWFPLLLSVAVLLFAFSTMISWSYYGERCFVLLFGQNTSMIYRLIFCVFVFFGCVFKLGNVLDFSDLMVLGMAFPNIFGAVILSGKVKERLDDYWGRYKAGNMPTTNR